MTWSVGVNKKPLAVYFDGRQFENMAEVLCLHQRIIYQEGKVKIFTNAKGSRQKKRSFYGQPVKLTVRGGSPPSALTVSKCENFGPIFSIIK